MPKLEIPERHLSALVRLLNLDANDFERLLAAATDANPLTRLRAIVGPEDAPKIADTIDSLYAVQFSAEASVEDFAEDICEAIEASGTGDKLLSRSNRGALKQRLKSLLSIEPLALNHKAKDLQTEDERTFCDARIITDLRPVFGPDVTENPRGVVMVHLLKLVYHDATDESHRSFHVSLDAQDLACLKDVIERAERKAQSLSRSLEGVGIRRLGI